jgi:CRP/FNR family transcriptional regulator, cyclic AMP receptor protein
MSPNELNFLLSTPYFRKCSLTNMAMFRGHLKTRIVQENDTIFSQGVVESNWYLVREGSVQIKRTSQTGVASTLAEIGAGEAFGEMGILERAPRLATAIAAEATVLYVLEASVFQTLLEEADPVALAMLRAMAVTQSRRLREMTLTMQDLTELDDLGDYAPTTGPLDLGALLSASYLLS